MKSQSEIDIEMCGHELTVYGCDTKTAMTDYEAIDAILQELERARLLHPKWPTDPIHQVAVMAEESGEAVRAALRMVYERGSVEELRTELIQTGAMAIRCLVNLKY